MIMPDFRARAGFRGLGRRTRQWAGAGPGSPSHPGARGGCWPGRGFDSVWAHHGKSAPATLIRTTKKKGDAIVLRVRRCPIKTGPNDASHTLTSCCRHGYVAPTLGFLQRRWRARAARPCWTNQGGGSQRAISVHGGGCATGRVAQLNCRRGASAADASRPDQAARASSLASDASVAGNELVATTTFACRPGQLRSPAGERRHLLLFVSRCGCR